MTKTEIRLHFTGPDRSCDTCGRWLVRIHEDGTYDHAGRSGIEVSGGYGADSEWTEDGSLVVYITDAICLRRACRLRRWLRLGT